MAAKQIDTGLAQDIVADWRTGHFNQREIAEKRRVSLGTVNKLCKGVARDNADIVNAAVQYRQALAAQDEHNVNAIMAVVDERTRHIQFFTNATVKNIGRMLDKINNSTSIVEHRVAQAAIKDGRETVLGKSPDVAVQINNAPTPSYHIPDDPIAASAAYQRIMQGT